MSRQFVESLRDLARQACCSEGRRTLVDDDQVLSDLECHLDEPRAIAVIRNLAATECHHTRSRLRRFISPILSSVAPTNLKFQALCNLVQNYPAHARLVFPNVVFPDVYNEFEAARALLFACIRCDDDSFAAFLERRDLIGLTMNVADDIEWALLTVKLLLQKSRLDCLLELSPEQLRFALEVLESCLQPDIISFLTTILQSWLSEFGPHLLAQNDVPEVQLDLLYAALSLANEAVILPGTVFDERLADVTLNLLSACGQGDGPKPTRTGPNSDIPTTPHSMKAILVRLLANLAGVDERSRRRIGEDDALLLLLNQTKIDDQNPFIREWVIVAIRHLTQDDPEVQRRIAEIQPTPFQTVQVEM